METRNNERRDAERQKAREVSSWFAEHIAAYYQTLLSKSVPVDLAHHLTVQYQLTLITAPDAQVGQV